VLEKIILLYIFVLEHIKPLGHKMNFNHLANKLLWKKQNFQGYFQKVSIKL